MHYVIVAVIALLVGVALGYAFRGKEHAALAAADSKAQGVVSSIGKKL